MRPYMGVIIAAHRKALTRLLVSDHILAVEQLRRADRYRLRVPREHRLCRLCGVAVEDEAHALLACEGSQELLALRTGWYASLPLRGRGMPHGVQLIMHMSQQREDDRLAQWARYVFRVFAVYETVPLYVPDTYRKRQ
ncbi:hypothetical protein BD626DRAFT_279380 [Schizophyllum amplum]|uniref:Reverse transcriptase zinc-binding domain-containing protein n=1 Tax=Schizophyllum amplum TaxID=97359 RepID=A0A550BT93_9AGAR|nr:hypothetical protein BD626DRAFT_279380 [Auriculariopsis ampla]